MRTAKRAALRSAQKLQEDVQGPLGGIGESVDDRNDSCCAIDVSIDPNKFFPGQNMGAVCSVTKGDNPVSHSLLGVASARI